ncbi:MAG TPA: efflux RND transporter periplasmic adaptor subunit [Ectothiorhodospiraceae bacterium]|nr:efflux RND transporter periplasmic adaptor subunit [Ectothiorhodospiraceae bacterium]
MNIRKYSPLIVIVLTVVVIQLIGHFKPEAKKQSVKKVPAISVETVVIQPRQYQIILESFGKIEPRIRGVLSSQVSGQIIAVSPEFREGGFFEEGALLLTIDPRDYNVQVEIAEAELAEMRVGYEEQQALAEQAKKDWDDLGRKGKASAFALRKPQLEAARLKIDSARAKLKQARLAVERTKIKAPYRGRLLSKNVDIGDLVATTAKLAEIYAIDLLEIRLPLKNSELAFIDLPERDMASSPRVTIENSLGADSQYWDATVVRTAGAIDEMSQQLYVTAQINQESESGESRRPLKIGQFVNARIEGRTIDKAMVIPNSTIYQGSYLYLVKDSLLQRKEIEIAWQNRDEALISSGIKAGDQLVLTPLGQVSSGTRVKMVNSEKQRAATDNSNKRSAR